MYSNDREPDHVTRVKNDQRSDQAVVDDREPHHTMISL
jgi:hypothetical protein